MALHHLNLEWREREGERGGTLDARGGRHCTSSVATVSERFGRAKPLTTATKALPLARSPLILAEPSSTRQCLCLHVGRRGDGGGEGIQWLQQVHAGAMGPRHWRLPRVKGSGVARSQRDNEQRRQNVPQCVMGGGVGSRVVGHKISPKTVNHSRKMRANPRDGSRGGYNGKCFSTCFFGSGSYNGKCFSACFFGINRWFSSPMLLGSLSCRTGAPTPPRGQSEMTAGAAGGRPSSCCSTWKESVGTPVQMWHQQGEMKPVRAAAVVDGSHTRIS
nr:unnamed protein product [Digitaria exilis]